MSLAAQEPTQAHVPAAVAPPSGHPRFPLLDGLRAFAALGVLVSHASGVAHTSTLYWWGPALANGSQGVTVFFVLSGFLLYRPMANAAMNGAPAAPWWLYARRRLLRIVPAYWLALTVLAATTDLPGVFGGQWWHYYFFLQWYDPATAGRGLSVSWSVCIEVTFYLLLPFWACGISRITAGRPVRTRVRWELSILALAAAASVAFGYLDEAFPLSLPVYFEWFAAGMAVAVLSAAATEHPEPRWVARIRRRPGLVWTGALAVYVLICCVLGPPQEHGFPWWKEIFITRVLGVAAAALLVLPAVFGQRGGGLPRQVLALRPLAWVGLISYGIYLWHLSLLEQITGHVSIHGNQGLVAFVGLTGLTVAAALAVAALSYYVLERPLLRLKFRRAPSPPPVTPEAVHTA